MKNLFYILIIMCSFMCLVSCKTIKNFFNPLGEETSKTYSTTNKTLEQNTAENTTKKNSLLPDSYDDNGIFSEYYEKAYRRLNTMSLEEKVGQLFLARCPIDGAIDMIKDYKIGGFVLFGRDFENKTLDEVKDTIKSYQDAANIPLIISTDEEGGNVVRVSKNPALSDHIFQSPQDLFLLGGLSKIEDDSLEKANLLYKLGINMNLAPVADVSENPEDFIYYRTFGKNADETKDYVTTVVKASQSQNVSNTLKHFPGYGNNVDTHTGISIDDRPYESFENSDFIPFIAGIKEGVHSILVSHNIVNCMDDSYPSSLSPKVHNILRDKLNFTGVIMTDDLDMDAIKLYTSGEHPAVQAVLAGNDMIIITDVAEGYSEVLLAVMNEKIPKELINRAAFRILSLKYAKKMI